MCSLVQLVAGLVGRGFLSGAFHVTVAEDSMELFGHLHGENLHLAKD